MKTYNIPRIQEGPATLDNLNAPINVLQKAVNDLSYRLDTLSNKSAIIQWQAPIDIQQVSVGDLVYFDVQSSLFRRAKASLLGKTGSQGQSVQSPSSRVQGLIISIQRTDKSAVLLRNGYYQDTVIQATLGNGALPGQYFLSPDNPGKATLDPGWNLRQPCISYYGDGKFSLCTNYLAHDNHHHGSSIINSWNVVTDSQDAPEGAKFYYTVSQYQNIGEFSKQTTAVFYNGILNTSDFQFSPDTIWFKGDSIPEKDSVVLFNNYPFAYGDSVIRSITSSSMDVRNYNGNAYIQMPSYTYTEEQRDKAIVSIRGTQIIETPVVSQILSGPGISVDKLGYGKVQINSTRFNDTPIPATDMYLNGTQRVAKGILVYTVFPALQTTYFVMSLPIHQGIVKGSKIDIRPWIISCGPGATRLEVKLYWIPTSQTGARSPIPTQSNYISTMFIDASNMSVTQLQYKQSNTVATLNVQSVGTIVAKVQATTPSYDMFIYQSGFRFGINNGQVSKTRSTDIDGDVVQEAEKLFEQRLTFNANY